MAMRRWVSHREEMGTSNQARASVHLLVLLFSL
jgi:hypothetical protein